MRQAIYNQIQKINREQGMGAAVTASFASIAMTGYLWSQIVTGLVPPVV